MRLKITLDKGRNIEIPGKVLTKMRQYRQLKDENEAGGVVVGKRLYNGGIVVVDITVPSGDDYRKRCRFSKKSKNHQMFLDKFFEESKGYVSMVGEWHSHPEKNPRASHIDKDSWKKIMRDNDDSLFFIIIGMETDSFYYQSNGSWRLKELKHEDYDEKI